MRAVPVPDVGETDAPEREARPHYHGHRKRLRERLLQSGADALQDYEILELVLCNAQPRVDVKPLAKALLARFGSFAEVISAPPARLREVDGVGEAAVANSRSSRRPPSEWREPN